MPVRWRVGFLALGLALVHPAGLVAQRGDSSLVARWRSIADDSARLSALMEATAHGGGARALHAVLETLSDVHRPTRIRLAAMGALIGYTAPARECRAWLLDTTRTSERVLCLIDHPNYFASSSIEPMLRDSIFGHLRAASLERGAVGRVARWTLLASQPPERWDGPTADWCRRAAFTFPSALRMSAQSIASDELRELARCTESGPPALVLAWRAVPADSVLLDRLRQISGEVRDDRLYRALLGLAGDPKRPIAVRVAAVDAIAPLLHPGLYWFDSVRARTNPSRNCSVWGPFGVHEAVQFEGGEPMGAASRRKGISDLRRLAETVKQPKVAEAARLVARCARTALDARPVQLW